MTREELRDRLQVESEKARNLGQVASDLQGRMERAAEGRTLAERQLRTVGIVLAGGNLEVAYYSDVAERARTMMQERKLREQAIGELEAKVSALGRTNDALARELASKIGKGHRGKK
jgi:hypothetical protein